MTTPSRKSYKKLSSNKKAQRDYLVLESLETGIELRGTEVKSIRDGNLNLTGSFAKTEQGQVILYGLNISPYEYGNQFNHVADRPRRLLLHRREITRLQVQSEQKGNALIPLSVYMKHGLVKVELGICKGKRQSDKRDDLRKKTADRDTARAIANHQRR